MKFKTFNFDLKYFWKWQFFHYENVFRFKNNLQLPGARRTRVGHHHGRDTSTSAWAILHHTDQNGPNILTGSVYHDAQRLIKSCGLNFRTLSIEKRLHTRKTEYSKICKIVNFGYYVVNSSFATNVSMNIL